MKKVLLFITLLIGAYSFGQTIMVNGSPYLATLNNSFPFWLDAGSTLATNPPMNFISVIEYNENELVDATNLGYSKVLSITESSVVPEGKVWKVVSVLQFYYEGCTDEVAENYDANANIDNSSCIYLGCFDSNACNFDSSSNTDDGSCEFPEPFYDCDENLFVQVGDMTLGGIVFYVDETNQHGLVSSLIDGGSFEWGCYNTVTGITNQAIGSGNQNTTSIINDGCIPVYGTKTAAQVAFEFESEGYDDWYLPSLNELWEMYYTIGQGSSTDNVGDFSDRYWSSSENNPNPSGSSAYSIRFIQGGVYSDGKVAGNIVRPIRSF